MQITPPANHGCTLNQVDPKFETLEQYDFKYIGDTVYELAESTSEPVAPFVKEALSVIEEAYKLYGKEGISLSFNGGKDCTVLLHLVAAVLSRLNGKHQLRTVYITYPNPFPHVDAFVDVCAQRYNLDCVAIPGPMRTALQTFLDSTHPKPKAIFVGIRRNDPYAGDLTHFDMTDKDWPQFMRVHPIINWSFKNVWDFLRYLKVPYCSLYDMGYTSLGSMENTDPNPDLLADNGYQPAYMLEDERHERCGRAGSSKK